MQVCSLLLVSYTSASREGYFDDNSTKTVTNATEGTPLTITRECTDTVQATDYRASNDTRETQTS